MKTFLYATDYSKNSVAALKYALKLSLLMDARLVVSHVLAYPVITEAMVLKELPELQKSALKANRVRLEEFCERHLGKEWKAMNLQIEPVENMYVLEGILEIANKWHAELIITGMRGESTVADFLLGSTTKRLIKKAPCPILAIPSDIRYALPKTIVYATDFEEEDIYTIRKLTELAEPLQAEIKVVHIVTKKDYSGETELEWFKDMLEEKVDYNQIEFELLFSKDILETLRNYLRDVGADMVVMLERKKSGFLKKWFHMDKVKKMESYGRIPLLSFNEANHQILHFSLSR